MLADSLPEHMWVKGLDKRGEVSQEQAKRYIKWVQKLVEKLEPKVVIFCGQLSHVFGACKDILIDNVARHSRHSELGTQESGALLLI